MGQQIVVATIQSTPIRRLTSGSSEQTTGSIPCVTEGHLVETYSALYHWVLYKKTRLTTTAGRVVGRLLDFLLEKLDL